MGRLKRTARTASGFLVLGGFMVAYSTVTGVCYLTQGIKRRVWDLTEVPYRKVVGYEGDDEIFLGYEKIDEED